MVRRAAIVSGLRRHRSASASWVRLAPTRIRRSSSAKVSGTSAPWLPSEANQQEDPERDAPFSPWPRPGPGSHQPGVEPPGRGRRALGEVELVASGQVHQGPLASATGSTERTPLTAPRHPAGSPRPVSGRGDPGFAARAGGPSARLHRSVSRWWPLRPVGRVLCSTGPGCSWHQWSAGRG